MKTIELDSRPITGTANNNSFYVESESGKYPIGSTLNWTTQKGGGRRGPARTLSHTMIVSGTGDSFISEFGQKVQRFYGEYTLNGEI
jgi:hypothetical protein